LVEVTPFYDIILSRKPLDGFFAHQVFTFAEQREYNYLENGGSGSWKR